MAPDLDLETATALRSATAQDFVQHWEMVQVMAQSMAMALGLGARLGKLFESPCMVPPASLDVPRNGRVDGQALVGNAAMVARETTVTATRFVTSTGMSL